MLFYKLLLTLNDTSWMAIMYAINKKWTVGNMPNQWFEIILLIVPVLMSWLSLGGTRLYTTLVGNEKRIANSVITLS